MRATNFEFRQRFWFFGAIFGVSFFLYAIDHQNATNALSAWLSKWDGLGGDGNVNVVLWLAAAVAALSAGVRVWATAYLRADVMFDPNLHSERLVADGPYRRVRNPLYLGNIFLLVAMAPLASRVGAVTLIVLGFIFILRLILREEAELRASQGESYARFTQAVPRLLPALRPRLPASGASPEWMQAIRGEFYVIAFALAVVAFAITKDQRFLWGFVILGFAAAFAFSMQWGKPKNEQHSA